MIKTWCFLALLIALPPLFSSLPEHDSDDDADKRGRDLEDVYPDLRKESVPHQVAYIGFPLLVVVLLAVMFIVVFIVVWKNRTGRVCCFEKCRSDAMRRRQMAMYEAQARMQLRQAEARDERNAYEKHLKQEEKQKAAAPPSYEKSMDHEVVDDTVPLV